MSKKEVYVDVPPPPNSREARDTLHAAGPMHRTSLIQKLVIKFRPARRLPIWVRYPVTALFVLVCFLIRYALESVYPYPFLPFLPGVIMASLVFDRGTGMFASLLSTVLAGYFFMEPRYSFAVASGGEAISLAFFLFICLLTGAVIEALRVSIDEFSDSVARLEESDARFRAILNTAVDAIVTIDHKGIIQSINPATERIFGYAAGDMVGQNVSMLMSKSEAHAHDGYIANYLRTGMPKVIGVGREIEGKRKDGSLVPLHLSIAEWKDASGNLFFTGVMRDITAQKKYLKALEESNRNLDDFVHIVSHDLKEPVRGINNFAGFLLEDYQDRMDEEGRDQLEMLKNLSLRMQTLVEDLLHYAKMGKEDDIHEEVAPDKVIEEVLHLMEIQLKKENASVILKNPMPVVYCSKAHVAEIFRNLITNAIKYNKSPVKKIEIGSTTCHTKYPDQTIFFVKDNGIGIPTEHKETVFNMFKRLHGRDEFGGGTGAGLAIVKKLVEQHNGKIWVETNENGGSTFCFYLECEKS